MGLFDRNRKETEIIEEEATSELEKTIEIDQQATKGIETIDEVTDEEKTLVYDGDQEEEEDDDDEYEYVTTNYVGYAISITILSLLVGAAAVFMLVSGRMSQEIRNAYIEQGYVRTTGTNAISSDIEEGYTAYVNGRLVTGSYVEVDTSLATATAADILSGYTAYVNGQKVIGNIPTFTPNSTYTPGSKDIIIPKGYYINGNIVIQGDNNLLPANIKDGVEIFDVKGTYKYTGN